MTKNLIEKKPRLSKKQFKELFQEPTSDYLEKINTISSDGKNLLVRIPQEFVKFFSIQKGDKLRFYVKIKENKKPSMIELNLIK